MGFAVSHIVCISFVPLCSHFALQRVPLASAAHGCFAAGTAGELSSTCPGRLSGPHIYTWITSSCLEA